MTRRKPQPDRSSENLPSQENVNLLNTEELEVMPPRGDAPKLVEIKISVPAGLLEASKKMRDFSGLSPGEFNRLVWILGLHAYAKGDNDLQSLLKALDTPIEGE